MNRKPSQIGTLKQISQPRHSTDRRPSWRTFKVLFASFALLARNLLSPARCKLKWKLGGHDVKFFLDTANLDELKKGASWGIVDGVTTNPSLIAKEGRPIEEQVRMICDIVDGDISAEVISLEAGAMIAEGRKLAKIHKNICLLYTSDAADDLTRVDLGGRRIIKKKK